MMSSTSIEVVYSPGRNVVKESRTQLQNNQNIKTEKLLLKA